MKKGKVFFHPIEGSGLLSISWTSGPKGDAVEAKNGSGVGFFSDRGDLVCVIFDEVQSDEDSQSLEFARHIVEVNIQKGKVTYIVRVKKQNKKIDKTKAKKRSPRKTLKIRCQ